MGESDNANGVTGELPEDIQWWTAKRRAALVLSIVKGETTVVEAARKHDLTVTEIERWKDTFLLAAENALRSRPKDEAAPRWRALVTLVGVEACGIRVKDLAEGLRMNPGSASRVLARASRRERADASFREQRRTLEAHLDEAPNGGSDSGR